MKLAPFGYEKAADTASEAEALAEDAVQLLRAFNRILDLDHQAAVLALAERYASTNPKFAEALAASKRKH